MSTANNNLFTEIAPEESAHVAGGGRRHHGTSAGTEIELGDVLNFNLNRYVFGLGAGVFAGNPGLTADEVQFAWENAIQYGPSIVSIV